MPWVRLDEDFHVHPRIVQAGPLALALQVAGLCYCNRHLTDGFVPRAAARTLLDWRIEHDGASWIIGVMGDEAVGGASLGVDVDSDLVVDLLVEHRLWEKVPGGYQIHDFHDYQPTKAEVLELRESRRAAGQRGGKANARRFANKGNGQSAGQTT